MIIIWWIRRDLDAKPIYAPWEKGTTAKGYPNIITSEPDKERTLRADQTSKEGIRA